MENFFETGNSEPAAKVKRGRGRPPFSEEKKAAIKAKRDAGKTKSFSVGEEPNKRIKKDGKVERWKDGK